MLLNNFSDFQSYKNKIGVNMDIHIWVSSYSSILSVADQNRIFCKICKDSFKCDRPSKITKHLETNKHKTNASIQSSKCNTDTDTFMYELCEAFVCADIPFAKLNNPTLKTFLEKYCKRKIPDESTIRRGYITPVYNNVVSEIKDQLSEQKVWISVDETHNSLGLSVANVIVGHLDKSCHMKPYLVTSKVLNATNFQTISNLVEESLNFISIKLENILLLVTDGASYMLKAGKTLKENMPNLIHVTCFVHNLHRVAEFIRNEFKVIDNIISDCKKIFLKCPSRIQTFRNINPNLALPPQPVITRWGTWLKAALYYAENYDSVKNVILNLPNDSVTITRVKTLFESDVSIENLNFIQKYFNELPSVITVLETRGLSLTKSFETFDNFVYSLETIPGDFGARLREYVKELKLKNPGYKELNEIRLALLENNTSNLHSDIEFYSYAPVSSVEVERSFSVYKSILSDRRHQLTVDNLEKLLIINWNRR